MGIAIAFAGNYFDSVRQEEFIYLLISVSSCSFLLAANVIHFGNAYAVVIGQEAVNHSYRRLASYFDVEHIVVLIEELDSALAIKVDVVKRIA